MKTLSSLGKTLQSNNILLLSRNNVFGEMSRRNVLIGNTIKMCFSTQAQNKKYSKETMDKLKQESLKFMENTIISKETSSSSIIELRDPDDWKTHVVGSKKPIVLDCYASWCEPCKTLAPKLEEACKKANGEWILVKFDIDALPKLASALQLKSVPTVLLINGGSVIDGFVGVEEENIKKFFETLSKLTGASKEKEELKMKIDDLEKKMFNQSPISEISEELQNMIKNERTKNMFGARLLALLSYCSIKEGKKEESLKYIYEINQKFSDDLKDEQIQNIIKLAEEEIARLNEKSRSDPKLNELENKVKENPGDKQSRYDLAELQFKNGINQEAIENCIEIMKIERNWSENKSMKLLLQIFEKLGHSNSLVKEARKKMQRLLY